MRIFSERSEDIKSRTELNPEHVPEIKDSPGKSWTNGQMEKNVNWPYVWTDLKPAAGQNHVRFDIFLAELLCQRQT